MDARRRQLVIGCAASAAALPAWVGRAHAFEPGTPLPVPPLVEAGNTGATLLEAIEGTSAFFAGRSTPSRGFSQPFLGPVLKLTRGRTARIDIRNRLRETITVHWHGLHVPGDVDGGPHGEVAPGARWQPALDVDQPASTAWYHSHVHGRTGPQVYSGLAGLLIIDDPARREAALPQRYGIDDLPLVLQDRAFAADGRMLYAMGGMMGAMLGVRGDRLLVNGAITPVAAVPAGVVRLRLLNACNARILHLHFEDGRPLHQVASDGGLLPRPLALKSLTLAPGERAEVLVDFATAASARLLSAPDRNSPMGGMGGMGGMGRGMGMMGSGTNPAAVAADGAFEVMQFRVDATREAAVRTLPQQLATAPPPPQLGEPARRRRFVLDTHGMMGGGMGRGGGGGGMGGGMGMMAMTINGRAFDMDRVDFATRRGETELWEVSAGDMAHPFHVHGTSFQVLSHNGRAVDFSTTGWKDTVLVDGRTELLMRFDHRAGEHTPYMFHCHILEHEDAGMMGQFTVA